MQRARKTWKTLNKSKLLMTRLNLKDLWGRTPIRLRRYVVDTTVIVVGKLVSSILAHHLFTKLSRCNNCRCGRRLWYVQAWNIPMCSCLHVPFIRNSNRQQSIKSQIYWISPSAKTVSLFHHRQEIRVKLFQIRWPPTWPPATILKEVTLISIIRVFLCTHCTDCTPDSHHFHLTFQCKLQLILILCQTILCQDRCMCHHTAIHSHPKVPLMLLALCSQTNFPHRPWCRIIICQTILCQHRCMRHQRPLAIHSQCQHLLHLPAWANLKVRT